MSSPEPTAADRPTLSSRLSGLDDAEPDALLDLFIDWVSDLGFELFPAQEEALLELFAERHVILNTPTGSGKSLVAAGLHFKALAEGKRSYYTSPIKALASEKFFDLCRDFGPENVGMLTGDASINPEAPLICCTAEVLSNLAVRRGDSLDADTVVMDEFHYYSDPERGVAWQIPLITLPASHFLLMSATLGNPAPIAERLERFSGRKVATVTSVERPVPLEFEYSERVIQETIERLAEGGRAPIYVVNFTQRECAELAGNLTSLKLTDKAHKKRINEAIGDFSFDTTYGKEMRRFLSFGIGVHHAGLLPKYRLLVEQLAQQGLLRVICGTDTLGVGVNIPIRTVLFRKLCKFDGTEMTILSVRDFKQIAGRAGRKGFDDAGTVVCQAPEHVVENLKQDRKLKSKGGKAKKPPRKQPPKFGYLHWDEQTFNRLIERPPETLVSRFKVSHSMLLGLIQRDGEENDPECGNFASLRELITNSHESQQRKDELISESAHLVRALHRAGIVKMVRDTDSGYRWVVVDETLQIDFALHQSLSLFLVETLERLDPGAEDFAALVLSLAESILEDPMLILRRQVDKAKDDLVARLKAEGVDYDERMARLEEVSHPKPNAELIYSHFNAFRERNPWAFQDSVRPKGIGTEIWETYADFNDYVRSYGIQRSEGLLLRYVSQLFKVLSQTVPVDIKTEEVWEMLGFFRALLARVDNSLINEWESMLHPETGTKRIAGTERGEHALEDFELLRSPKAFRARVRAELHQLVRALSRRDYEEALLCVWRPLAEGEADAEQPSVDERQDAIWTAERFEQALEPFFERYEEILFDPQARLAHHTHIEQQDAGHFAVSHTLLDPDGDNFWHLEGVVVLDLGARAATAAELGLDRPLLRLRAITD